MSSNNSSDGDLLPRPATVVRPPLPPAHPRASPPRPGAPPSPQSLLPHDRSTSFGEDSEVSALSVPPEDGNNNNYNYSNNTTSQNGGGGGGGASSRRLGGPAKPAGHRRTVSWGFAAKNNNNAQTGSVLYQPDLTTNAPTMNGNGISSSGAAAFPASSSAGGESSPPVDLKPKPDLSPAPSYESGSQQQQQQGRTRMGRGGHQQPGHVRNNTRVTLTEVAASPLEDEAETAIIRALEAREWENDNESDDLKFQRNMNLARTASTINRQASIQALGILGNVPDNALRIVAEEEEAAALAAAAAAEAEADTSPSSGNDTANSANGDSPNHPTPPHANNGSTSALDPSHRAGGGANRFQDIAGQLQAMQGVQGGTTRQFNQDGGTGGGGGGGGYLRKAAAALRAQEMSRRSIHGSGHTGPGVGGLATAKQQGDAHYEDEEEERVPVSSADEMVHNLNRVYGLPNVADQEDAFDVEAQHQQNKAQTQGAPASPASKWGKVRLAVNTASQMQASAQATPGRGGGQGPDGPASAGGGGGEGDGTPGNEEKDGPSDGMTSFAVPNGKKKGCWCSASCNRCIRNFRDIVLEVCSALHFKAYVKATVGYVIIPSCFISAILFYAAGNPLTGTKKEQELGQAASYSWWLLFVGARQICTFSLSKLTEIVMVDTFTLRTRTFLRLFGPFITLLIIQARGWPYILTFWAVWDFALLQGKHRFARHWLYYARIAWFKDCEGGLLENGECNPAGDVIYSDIYFRVLISCIVFGCCVGLKRGYLAMYQGKKSTETYGPQLEKLMKKMLLISEAAHLAFEIWEANEGFSPRYFGAPQGGGLDYKRLRGLKHLESDAADYDDDDDSRSKTSQPSPPRSPITPPVKPSGDDGGRNLRDSMMRFRAGTEDYATPSTRTNMSKYTVDTETPPGRPRLDKAQAHVSLGETAKLKLIELVGEWEEPTMMNSSKLKDISIQDILQFRQAVLCLDQKFPFGYAFGPARTREICIESAQNVYERLLLHTPDDVLLPFDTLALVALDKNGEIDERKAKKLIRLFRPDRDGYLTALDFVKSCDKVYKELRTLRAAIANSSQIDHAFEQIVNIAFYFILFMIVLTILKLDPWTLFLSLSGFILSFAFMFGSAASKYFEGILLILVQHPFDIGDRVHISNVQRDTSPNGSSTWFVEAVTLFATTVRYATTNEVATYSNGSLAASRIINSNRSPKATVYIYNKFASDVPFEKVMVFKSVVESFVKERPRQWIAMSGFRATRVEADLGFIEYVIVLQHVEKWQNIGPILNSKAEVSSYCLEVQKKLGMRYEAPPLPVNLGINRAVKDGSLFEQDQIGDDQVAPSSEPDFSAIANLFTKPEAKKTK